MVLCAFNQAWSAPGVYKRLGFYNESHPRFAAIRGDPCRAEQSWSRFGTLRDRDKPLETGKFGIGSMAERVGANRKRHLPKRRKGLLFNLSARRHYALSCPDRIIPQNPLRRSSTLAAQSSVRLPQPQAGVKSEWASIFSSPIPP